MIRKLYNLFKSENERKIIKIKKDVEIINSLEKNFELLSDIELSNTTNILKKKLQTSKLGLEEVLHESFAAVREASKRALGKRHFDVQLMGGIILHEGSVAEMQTGEGKTLVATLPAYLNALTEKSVHIVTVNDYLAKRDSEWMGKIFNFLNLSVGCVTGATSPEERIKAYNSDILYITNNELGFDYLKDNMQYSLKSKIQRELNFAIIDEVDSILIDEARTPLIISGPVNENLDFYPIINSVVTKLKEQDFEKDLENKSIHLTDNGILEIENLLKAKGLIQQESTIYDEKNISLINYINQSLKANFILKKDVDYIVQNRKVMIIDEFTGRVLEGRRFSEGLHQSIEAKENLPIQNETQTLASITFQNYFRMYKKLSGMTGTAMTEASELRDIYNLNVVSVPPNKKNIRKNLDDEIYGTKEEKYSSIIELIKERHEKGQPILVGTTSIEKSEIISQKLKKIKIKHNVLNAKNHEEEAYIIAQAGKHKSVTIATNMAGRGTDILLGGNSEMILLQKLQKKTLINKNIDKIKKEIEENVLSEKEKVRSLGGLLVIGTERHESRRIDNQLRGRSGRQGDPGEGKFFLSLEDDLLVMFAPKTISAILRKIGLKNGEAINHPMITNAIAKAQYKVEQSHYEMRKTLLKFDDVINQQRKIFYEQRNEVITAKDLEPFVLNLANQALNTIISNYITKNSFKEEWQINDLSREIKNSTGIDIDPEIILNQCSSPEEILELYLSKLKNLYYEKETIYTQKVLNNVTRYLLLRSLDKLWKEHLYKIDHLRQGISLRAYGQKDPLNEYKFEAFNLFEKMLKNLSNIFIKTIYHLHINTKQDITYDDLIQEKNTPRVSLNRVKNTFNQNIDHEKKISRNSLCPCGSNKKYKHCHGLIKDSLFYKNKVLNNK